MAGNELDIIAERPELLMDRVDQRLVIAARKIGAADRAGEEHIADQGQFRRGMEKHHMPRRMAGCVQHLSLIHILQIDVQATRRRIELLQASVNHGTPITQEGVAEIDHRIATELADWRWQLVAREHALADAREFLAGIVLVDAGEATRVKSAYRRLARWLHPDASPENFDLFQKYWPAVQEAYRRVDRGLIEALLHLVEHALDTRAGKQSADIPSELDRLRVFVATHAERLARLRTEPPHCYAELLTDDAWVAARQSALERAIAAESERLAQLVMRLAELMARICIHRD